MPRQCRKSDGRASRPGRQGPRDHPPRLRDIRVHIRQRVIDPALRGDYENDAAFRERFQAWVNALWAEKDADVGRLLGA